MVFAIFCITLAVVMMLMAGKMLARSDWFISWLRGTTAMMLFLLGVLLTLAGMDLLSYKRAFEGFPLLTISFERQGEQFFKATLLDVTEGSERHFDLLGDQWQVDVRMMRWRGLLKILGGKPAYRLDRLSGRYYSLEDERRKSRSVYQLMHSEYGFDTWQWLQQNAVYMPLVDAVYGSATFLPMEDGAIFEISLSANGLVSKPLNDIAQRAIQRWQ